MTLNTFVVSFCSATVTQSRETGSAIHPPTSFKCGGVRHCEQDCTEKEQLGYECKRLGHVAACCLNKRIDFVEVPQEHHGAYTFEFGTTRDTSTLLVLAEPASPCAEPACSGGSMFVGLIYEDASMMEVEGTQTGVVRNPQYPAYPTPPPSMRTIEEVREECLKLFKPVDA